MSTNLLSNRELENYQIDDHFNFKVKADAIKHFLEFNSTALEKNKMVVLYGDWGSGKTSLMRHIEKEIDKDIYFPIFFQAWEHEKDENLPLSLCDALLNHVDSNLDITKKFIKGAFATLRSFTNGVTLKTSGVLSGLGLDIEISGEKINEALDNALKDDTPKSFYKSNKEFKESFKAIEELILRKHNAQKLLIFVDDLDRCEPENVLNLITALKLFFTYGEKCIFLCGIDKEAVTKAVKTRYKDVIKSEEYMEKVFDISFNMPKTFSLKNILKAHFFEKKIDLLNGYKSSSIDIIEDFLVSINFTTPRHLKKVLNKYKILREFKNLDSIPPEIRNLVPNLIDNENGNTFETIYCLYFIILREFFYYDFIDVENYEHRMSNYVDIVYNSRKKTTSNASYNKAQASQEVYTNLTLHNAATATFKKIVDSANQQGLNPSGYIKFILFFSHGKPMELTHLFDNDLKKFGYFFPDNSISTNFCKFLIRNIEEIQRETSNSTYVIWNLYRMVNYLL